MTDLLRWSDRQARSSGSGDVKKEKKKNKPFGLSVNGFACLRVKARDGHDGRVFQKGNALNVFPVTVLRPLLKASSNTLYIMEKIMGRNKSILKIQSDR